MRRITDPSRFVDVQTDIVPLDDQGLPRVDPDPNPDRPIRQSRLHLPRRIEGIRSPSERDKERIALDPELNPTMSRDRVTDPFAMALKLGAIALAAELLEQPRRALDISEHERDRPGRQSERLTVTSVR